QVQPGPGPTAAPFEPPLRLQPYDHENAVRGYRPAAALDNQPYFDRAGRAFVRTATGLAIGSPAGWTQVSLNEATIERIPAFSEPITGVPSTKVAFDADDDVYLLATAGRQLLLLHSADHGQSFRAYVIPGRTDRPRGLDFEQFSGNNVPVGPPPLVRNTQVPTEPDPKLFWRRVNELDLFLPRKANGRLELGEPIRVSDVSLGLSGHSGMPSAVVSRGDKVHVIWGEATPPEEKVPGVPTRVVTYDRTTARLGEPALIGYGPPANDIHNTPSITMDMDGFLHALTGTHGQPFHYARSRIANDSGGGWTAPEPTGAGLSQTYVGLVCGPDGTLHLVYRLSQRGVEPFPLAYQSTLTYQRKRPGQPWEPPRPLVVPAFSEYCVYYHRLTIDHTGTLYLSFDYWSTHWFYRNDQRTRPRTVLTSSDGGDSWRFWQG
ncbi:MAG: BNR-4 repeat-containing protein, partial [Armatimonadetes bacterium]|nr:BNR-4 repeat-containing protein [Armatimonadota bacterium]